MLNRLVIVVLFLTAMSVKAQTQLDRIVAVIGDKIILKSDIENQIKQAAQDGAALGPNAFALVLEETMFQKLLSHQADVDSLVVSDDQVEGELNQRLAYFISQLGSKERFESYYGKTTEKFKDDFRESVRDQMKARQMQGKISGDVKVTPKEVKEFYNNIPKDSIPLMGSKMELAHLVRMPQISLNEKLNLKAKLNEYRDKIIKGEESFCMVAVSISEDPGTKYNCGEFELVSRGQFVPEFDAVAFSMKEGEISEVFETKYGYHILKLLERRGDMYRGQHVLVMPKVSNEVMARESEKLDSIYRKIKEGVLKFEDAVRKFSSDAETKYNGGKMINPETGDTRFEANQIDKQLFITVDGMNPGDVSEPLLYQGEDQKQGLRIVKLLGRSEPHVANLKDDYPQISEAALNEKKSKTILKWVKSKVGSMYIWVDDEYKNLPFEYPWIKTQ